MPLIPGLSAWMRIRPDLSFAFDFASGGLFSRDSRSQIREPNASPVGISTVSRADLLFCLGCWFGSVWSDYGSVQSAGPADDDLDCELIFPVSR